MKTFPSLLLAATVLASTGCDSLNEAMGAHQGVVARAAGHELTVDEAAGMIAVNPRLPAQTEVVDVLANLWVDYILLATAAQEDSTLRNVPLDALLEPQFDQRVLFELRDSVIRVDTVITEEQLRAAYEEQQPGAEVRARHILLQMQPDASTAERDSLTRLAQELGDRARGGADFAELAREYSQDPGTAQEGGDLGFFGRGQMVPPFEDAAFALEPGEVSDVVESPFGLHVIKVEERRSQEFAEVRDRFAQDMRARRQAVAESTFVSDLRDPLDLRVNENAVEVARELARDPGRELGRRASNRDLVSYEGGELTAAELQEVLRFFQPQQRRRIDEAPDEVVETMLRRFADNEILLLEAERLGIGLSAALRDSARAETRTALIAAASGAGLIRIQPQDGETMEEAIERRVNTLIGSIIRQEQTPLILGALSYVLRASYPAEIMQRAYAAVVDQVEESRPAQSVTPQGQMPPGAMPPGAMPPSGTPQGQPRTPQGQAPQGQTAPGSGGQPTP